MYTNLPTSQDYIFRILQHFATNLCSFSNFDNFFPEISFVIPRLKIFLKRKSSIRKGKGEIMLERFTDQVVLYNDSLSHIYTSKITSQRLYNPVYVNHDCNTIFLNEFCFYSGVEYSPDLDFYS